MRPKNLSAVFCFVISFVISNVSWAQQLAGGEALLTIQMGKTERKFIFPNALPTTISAQKINSALAISFNKEFEKESESVGVIITVEPAGKGNFIMTQPNKEPPNIFSINIIYTKTNSHYEMKELILNSDWHNGPNGWEEGSSGTAEITQYGAVGSYVIGNFQANLVEFKKEDESSGSSYKVSGNFKIKLIKE